jgi:hypothetical protein
MSRARDRFVSSVFINCPFDETYLPIFEAVVFTVIAAGFRPRSALENIDSGTLRLRKIQGIIAGCRYGIHDLSRVELGAETRLPRFNMPFELGLDIAAKAFGGKALKAKRFLILDADPYRYQRFISDISGQDIHCHRGLPSTAMDITRNWLRATSRRSEVAGPLTIKRLYADFVQWLPEYCTQAGFDRKNLLFVDYVEMARQWVAAD